MRHCPTEFFPSDLSNAHANGTAGDAGPVRVARGDYHDHGSAEDAGEPHVSPRIAGLIGLAFGFGIIGIVGGVIAGVGAWGLVACYVVCGNIGLMLALLPSVLRTT